MSSLAGVLKANGIIEGQAGSKYCQSGDQLQDMALLCLAVWLIHRRGRSSNTELMFLTVLIVPQQVATPQWHVCC